MSAIPTWLGKLSMGVLAAVSALTQADAQTAIPPAPRDFVAMAVQSDQYEILAGYDAVTQATDSRVRVFAQQMIADHERLQEVMKQAAEASGLPPPASAMSSDQAQLLAGLQSRRGPDFDRAYVQQQVIAHIQALSVTQSFAASGSDSNLRRSAQSQSQIIQHHLHAAQELGSELQNR